MKIKQRYVYELKNFINEFMFKTLSDITYRTSDNSLRNISEDGMKKGKDIFEMWNVNEDNY